MHCSLLLSVQLGYSLNFLLLIENTVHWAGR
jgi:hypothetical protein